MCNLTVTASLDTCKIVVNYLSINLLKEKLGNCETKARRTLIVDYATFEVRAVIKILTLLIEHYRVCMGRKF